MVCASDLRIGPGRSNSPAVASPLFYLPNGVQGISCFLLANPSVAVAGGNEKLSIFMNLAAGFLRRQKDTSNLFIKQPPSAQVHPKFSTWEGSPLEVYVQVLLLDIFVHPLDSASGRLRRRFQHGHATSTSADYVCFNGYRSGRGFGHHHQQPCRNQLSRHLHRQLFRQYKGHSHRDCGH